MRRASQPCFRSARLGDPRVAAVFVALWSVTLIVVMASIGTFSTPFFHFGPAPALKLFDYAIDSWTRWSAVAVYIVVNQALQTYGLETISPWMLNQVENRSVREITETRAQTLNVVFVWYFWLWLSRIISIQLLLSQIDFLLLILLVDVGCTLLITDRIYLKSKLTGVSNVIDL